MWPALWTDRARPGQRRVPARGILFLPLALLAAMAAGRPPAARADTPLNAETMRAALRTGNPDEEAYITYVATLLEQGRLPRDLVYSTFLWARKKPEPKKAQYFKQAMITRAAEIGITLPEGTPALTGTIQGRVFTRVLTIEVPTPRVTVSIDNTKRQTMTDSAGHFTFKDVPFGTYTVRASGLVSLLLRKAAVQVILPSRPPSTQPVMVSLELK